MNDITRESLSGSVDGEPIAVAAVASPGTTVHTAPAGTTSWDEVFLFANLISGAANVDVTVELAGVATVNKIVTTLSPKNGPVELLPGVPIRNGKIVKVYAGTTNVVNVFGYVNRITPT